MVVTGLDRYHGLTENQGEAVRVLEAQSREKRIRLALMTPLVLQVSLAVSYHQVCSSAAFYWIELNRIYKCISVCQRAYGFLTLRALLLISKTTKHEHLLMTVKTRVQKRAECLPLVSTPPRIHCNDINRLTILKCRLTKSMPTKTPSNYNNRYFSPRQPESITANRYSREEVGERCLCRRRWLIAARPRGVRLIAANSPMPACYVDKGAMDVLFGGQTWDFLEA